MLPYFVVFILILFFLLLGKRTNDRRLLIPIYLILFLFAGFRYNVGVDYNNYILTFEGAEGYRSRELGFNWIINFVKFLGGAYQWIFILYAALTQYCVYKWIRKESTNPWMSTMIYCCFSTFYIATFNGVRQYAAIAIMMLALTYLKANKKYYFLLLCFAFVFCHQTAIMFVPLYFLWNKKLHLRAQLIILITSAFVGKFIAIIIQYTPYVFYLTLDKDYSISSAIYLFLILCLLLIFYKLFNRKILDTSLNSNLNLLCAVTLLLVLVQDNMVISQMLLRLNSYFLFPFILIVPEVIKSIRSAHIRLVSRVILVIVSIFYLFKTIYLSGVEYILVPYQMNFNLF